MQIQVYLTISFCTTWEKFFWITVSVLLDELDKSRVCQLEFAMHEENVVWLDVGVPPGHVRFAE